jgi:hypothetical protein
MPSSVPESSTVSLMAVGLLGPEGPSAGSSAVHRNPHLPAAHLQGDLGSDRTSRSTFSSTRSVILTFETRSIALTDSMPFSSSAKGGSASNRN